MFIKSTGGSLMNVIQKMPCALGLLFISSSTLSLGIYHILYNPSFWDIDDFYCNEIEEVREAMVHFGPIPKKECATSKSQKVHFGPSKEDREAIKIAHENLSKIKHEVKEEDGKVTISFTGFYNLTKDNVEIIQKKKGYLGTIKTQDGRIEFFISPKMLQINRQVEIEKDEEQFLISACETQVQAFDKILNIKAEPKIEPIRDNTLTLTFEIEQEKILEIPS